MWNVLSFVQLLLILVLTLEFPSQTLGFDLSESKSIKTTGEASSKPTVLSKTASYETSSNYEGYFAKSALLTGSNDLHQARMAGSDDVAPEFAFHTQLENSPFIIIDLGRECAIKQLLIENRLRQERQRAEGLSIWVSSNKIQWKEIAIGLHTQMKWEITLPEFQNARFVKIGLNRSNYLHLAHVQILGTEINKQQGESLPQSQLPETLIKSETIQASSSTQKINCGNGLFVSIPSGLINQPTVLSLSEAQQNPAKKIRAINPIRTFDLRLGNLHQLEKPVEIEIPLPAEIAGSQKTPLWARVFANYYDSDLNEWCSLPLTIDPNGHTAKVSTSHLSLISVGQVDDSWNIKYEEGQVSFVVLYNRKQVVAATSGYNNASGQTIEEPEVPRYIIAVLSGLEAAQAYAKCGLKFSNKIIVIYVQGQSNPVHNGITGNITFPLNVTSPIEVKRQLAHELFHNVERAYYNIPGMIGRRWWMEACAEYAASRIAVPEYGRRMGNHDSPMPPSYLSLPLTLLGTASDKLTANHEYHGSWFIDFLVNDCLQLRHETASQDTQATFFADMFKSVAQASFLANGFDYLTPLDTYIRSRCASSLDRCYFEFSNWYIFNKSSRMNTSNPAKIPRESMTDGVWMFKPNDPLRTFNVSLSGGHSTRTIRMTVSEDLQLVCSGVDLPDGVTIEAKKVADEARESVNPYGRPFPVPDSFILDTNKPQSVSMGSSDGLYFLLINNSNSDLNIAFTVAVEGAGAGFWKLTGPPEHKVISRFQASSAEMKSTITTSDGHVDGDYENNYSFGGWATRKRVHGSANWTPPPAKVPGDSKIHFPINCFVSGDLDPTNSSQGVKTKVFAQMLDIRPSHLTAFADAGHPNPPTTFFEILMPRLYDQHVTIPITLTISMPFAGEDSYTYSYEWIPPASSGPRK